MNELRCLGVLGAEVAEVYHMARRKPLNSKADAYMAYFLGSLAEDGLLVGQGFVLLDTTVKVKPKEFNGRLFVFQGKYNSFLAKMAPEMRVVESGFGHEWFFNLEDCVVVGLVVAVVPSGLGVWPLGDETVPGQNGEKPLCGPVLATGEGCAMALSDGHGNVGLGESFSNNAGEEEEGQWRGSLHA